MSRIHIFVDDKNKNEKLFYGKSTSELTSDAKITAYDAATRDELIEYAIKTSAKDSYILCAFGPLLTGLNPTSIYDVLEFVINKTKFDVFYLTLYGDICEYASDNYSYEHLTIRRSFSPHGTECILLSPSGAEKVSKMFNKTDGRSIDYYLNNKGEQMMLYSSFPPLLFVDVSKRDNDTQLVKGTICRENINSTKPVELTKRYTGNMNLFWFFLIVIFVLFIAAMIISFGNGNKNVDNCVCPNKPLGIPVGKQDLTGSFTT